MMTVGGASLVPASEIGIWGIKAPGVEAARVKQMVAELERFIGTLGGSQLVDSRLLQQRLEKAGILPGAPWEQVRPALQLDWIITGALTSVGGQITADLRLIDGRRGQELRRVTVEVAADAKERAGGIAELAVRLLAPEKWKGALLVETSVPGARIFLDDRQVAVTPLAAPLENLTPGKHILRVVKEGFADFSHFINVPYNQLVQVKVNLENSLIEGLLYRDESASPPPAPVPAVVKGPVEPLRPSRWPVWLTLGLGLAAGAAGTGLWVADHSAPAMVLVAAGVVTVAGSTVGLILTWPEQSPQSPPAGHAARFPNGLRLVWTFDF